MIKNFNKSNKIRLVGLLCSRDYFHEFTHYPNFIIEVTITFFVKVTKLLISVEEKIVAMSSRFYNFVHNRFGKLKKISQSIFSPVKIFFEAQFFAINLEGLNSNYN